MLIGSVVSKMSEDTIKVLQIDVRFIVRKNVCTLCIESSIPLVGLALAIKF